VVRPRTKKTFKSKAFCRLSVQSQHDICAKTLKLEITSAIHTLRIFNSIRYFVDLIFVENENS